MSKLVEVTQGDTDVRVLMDMVIGDYLAVLLGDEETSPRLGNQVKEGTRKVCRAFGLDLHKMDVDGLFAHRTEAGEDTDE